MTEAKRQKILRAAINTIKVGSFEESVKNRVYNCYEEVDDEFDETKQCGKFVLFYTEVDGETVIMVATAYNNNTIIITSLSHSGVRVVYTLNESNHSWSGIHPIGAIGDEDYISMHDILINVISVLKRLLFI